MNFVARISVLIFLSKKIWRHWGEREEESTQLMTEGVKEEGLMTGGDVIIEKLNSF